ncbi:hypothetical protein [Chryseobacterium ginsengisoli]
MTVVLKKEYQDDEFIKELNRQLTDEFGADDCPKFNPWYALQKDADYMNNDPDGLKEVPDWKRPITATKLSKNFFWLTHGEFSFKLSGCPTLEEAREAIAVCKWLIETNNYFIEAEKSDNYDKETVAEYLNYIFEEAGHTIDKIWEK